MTQDKTALLRSLKLDPTVRDAPQTQSVRPSWTLLAIGIIGGALLAGPAAWFLSPGRTKPVNEAPMPSTAPQPGPGTQQEATNTSAAQQGDLIASGYVIARRRATVAAQITGQVVEVRVEEGQIVTKGQLLARLDDSLIRADLAGSKSRVDAAAATIGAFESDLADAQRIYARTKQLAAKEFASTADLTRNQTRVSSLTAQLAQARAQLESARNAKQALNVQLSRYEIRAPFSGVVVDKNAQAGEIISPVSSGGGFTRTGICTLVDMSSLEIEVDVNEAFIGRVREGQKVEAVLDAYPDVVIPARVIATVPTANREKATVRVRVGIIGADARILPDMAIKVTFLEGKA
jgi:HlyD family secretion protein